MTEALRELGGYIEAKRPDCVLAWDVTHGELNIDVTLTNIAGLVEFLKADATCRFSTLVDITAVDYTGRAKRFDVVYHFLSMYQNHRVRLRVATRERHGAVAGRCAPLGQLVRARDFRHVRHTVQRPP